MLKPRSQIDRWSRSLIACTCALVFATQAHAQDAAAQTAILPPSVLERVDATYPPQALASGMQANVTLLVTVERDGTVGDVSVAESGGDAFDRAAIDAVKRWRFSAAHRGDETLASRIRVPFRFELPAVETPPAAPIATANSNAEPPLAPTPPDTPESAEVQTPATTPPAAIDVTVRGRARPVSRGAGDFQLEVGGLAAVPHQNASELLKLAPGILLTNEGGEAHAEQVFLRGFDAREGQDIEFSVGGVPINEAGNLHGNGYADTHFIIPELVSSLRVVEGPFDPRQGNFAVAGSADYELGLSEPGLTLKQTLGSFNTSRTLLLWGPGGADAGSFAGAELYRTDGYGQNRDGRRASAMAQYEARSGVHRYRLFASAYSASFHAAGVLREDDFERSKVGFFDSYDPAQGEDTSRYALSAEIESHLDRVVLRNQVFGIARPMRLRENFTGFLLDPQQPAQNPHPQRGDLLDLATMATTVGARGSARASERVFDQPQALELGYFAREDFVSGSQTRIEAATMHPYHRDTDLDSSLGDLGLFADLDLRATRWLAARGGLRGDLFSYDVLDRCAVSSVAHASRSDPPGDQSCLSQQDFGAYREPTQRSSTTGEALAPRASLLIGPFAGVGVSASVGRGVRSVDPVYVSQDAKTPFASVDAVEAGLTFARKFDSVDLSARSSLFQTRVDRDLVFSETAGRNILGGATTRRGSANSVRVQGRFFDAAANATYVHAVFADSGLLIPYIPEFVLRFDGALFERALLPKLNQTGRPLRASFGSGVSLVTPRPLPHGERGNTVFTVDLNATLGWWLFELGLSCTNLFDNRYRLGEYNYASDFHSQAFPTLVPVRHFSAGAPRALFLTLTLHLGGEP